jgi:predicted lipid-binding transport protein (Tim44 family)
VSRELIEILGLAALALFVVMRLYSVLGRRTGSERPEAPRPAAAPADVLTPGPPPAPAQASLGPPTGAGGGVADIIRADPGFEVAHFLAGARKAYEMIVQAFAAGDRDALRSLLTPSVFASYDAAIQSRVASGGKGPELVRLKTADLADAELDGVTARVAVRYEAELAEGAHGLRDTKERWTFERDTTSRDPNWRLAGVAQA